MERLRKSRSVRPLLGPTPTLAKIKQLYANRMPHYAHADYVLEADGLSSAQVVDAIVEWMHKKKIEL
jgi:shikimate kinase